MAKGQMRVPKEKKKPKQEKREKPLSAYKQQFGKGQAPTMMPGKKD